MYRRRSTVEFVLPYVGSEELLRAAVTSVLAQNDEEWTLLVVIDGPDEPPVETWLDGLGDDRIRHRRNHSNLGVAANFQVCLESARADLVTFLGCDDVLLPNYLTVVRRAIADHPDAGAVHPGVTIIDSDGREVMPLADRVKQVVARRRQGTIVLRGQRLLTSLMVGNWTYFPAVCWDRVQLERFGFRADLPVTLDLALWAELALAGRSLVVCEDPAFAYRRHAASVSSVAASNVSRFEEEARLHRELFEVCRRRGWWRAAIMAKLRPTSRLHALSLCPRAAKVGDRSLLRSLIRHVIA